MKARVSPIGLRPRGFIGIPALLAILLVLAASMGGTYYYLENRPPAPPNQELLEEVQTMLSTTTATQTADQPDVSHEFVGLWRQWVDLKDTDAQTGNMTESTFFTDSYIEFHSDGTFRFIEHGETFTFAPSNSWHTDSVATTTGTWSFSTPEQAHLAAGSDQYILKEVYSDLGPRYVVADLSDSGQTLEIFDDGNHTVYKRVQQVAKGVASKTFTNAQYGFSITYPPTLSIDTSAKEGAYYGTQILSIGYSDAIYVSADLSKCSPVSGSASNLQSQATFNGTTFTMYDISEPATGQLGLGHEYQAIHNNRCYTILATYVGAEPNHYEGAEKARVEAQNAAGLAAADSIARSFVFQ